MKILYASWLGLLVEFSCASIFSEFFSSFNVNCSDLKAHLMDTRIKGGFWHSSPLASTLALLTTATTTSLTTTSLDFALHGSTWAVCAKTRVLVSALTLAFQRLTYPVSRFDFGAVCARMPHLPICANLSTCSAMTPTSSYGRNKRRFNRWCAGGACN